MWKPKLNQGYYYITCDFVTVGHIYNTDCDSNHEHMRVNNCFKTKEEGEKKLEKIKAILKED